MENPFVIPRLGGGQHGDEKQDDDQIPADAVVFIDGLGVVDAAEHGREIKLGEANEGLDEEEDVGGETDNGVRGFKVGAVVTGFIVVDDNEAAEEREEGSPIENSVDVGAELLLLRGVGGLDDQNGLRAEEDPGGVEQL